MSPTKWPTVTIPDFTGSDPIIVETTLTVSGVTSSNFASMEASLKTVFATFFGVPESQIALSFVSGSRRHLQTGEILVQITTADATEMNTVLEDIREPTFVTAIQSDITTAAVSDSSLSVITITGKTTPVVATTTTTTAVPTTSTTAAPTTTTTTTMGSGSTALMTVFALIFSALMF
jgi:hypothetical protein